MEVAIELDEFERRFSLFLLLRQQPVQFQRQESPRTNGAADAKVLRRSSLPLLVPHPNPIGDAIVQMEAAVFVISAFVTDGPL
jgi:hypothetical protein